MNKYLFFLFVFFSGESFSQQPLITDIPSRKTQSLNGKWQYIIDPYETGFRNYRWDERNQNDREAYWNSDVPENKTDRKEHGYDEKYSLNVPGDWNSQEAKFLYYEGTVWYKRSFDAELPKGNEKVFLYFGAVNYRADVYLNGKKLGMHLGGFTPFNFEIPDGILKAKDNFLVVKVDNKRFKDEIPTLNTDWWNYGGITRDVNLVFVPKNFILDYSLQLQKSSATAKDKTVEGWVKFNSAVNEEVTIEIPELKVKKKIGVNGDKADFSFKLSNLQLWSPETPKLYQVIVSSKEDRIEDKIGFRTIEVQGKQILLNGQPIFCGEFVFMKRFPNRAEGLIANKMLCNYWDKQKS